MAKTAIISDIHGEWKKYLAILASLDTENIPSIQLGDLGVGFGTVPTIPPQHRFFVGNHDDRQLAHQIPNCLGDFGLTDQRFFFISGAWSIDREYRTLGVNWWDDEELSYEQLEIAIEVYEKAKPSIVISHDCPADIYNFFGYAGKSRTAQALQAMFQIHQPDKWIFGHHHIDFMSHYDGTEFHCIGEHKKMILEY